MTEIDNTAGNNEPPDGIPWHSKEEQDVLSHLETRRSGLSDGEAETRLKSNGPNTLEGERESHRFRMLIDQIKSPLIYVLGIAAVVSWFTGHHIDAGVILGVVIVNMIIGIIQEWRAEKALSALKRLSEPQARVIREDSEQTVDAADIVVGDILVLNAGDSVAADVRILKSEGLKINESSLTGESRPSSKEPGSLDTSIPIGDRSNMAWKSTAVTEGNGRGVVVATGMDTAIGHIAEHVRSTERERTPLQHRMDRLGSRLGLAGVGLAGAVFLLGLLRGKEPAEMVLFAVAIAVSAIPEGLPAVISITLALGVKRMAKRNAIVRRLPAVETLGSTNIICTDKTGTITHNEMMVSRVWTNGTIFEVAGSGYNPDGEISMSGKEDTSAEQTDLIRRLGRIGVLANNAKITASDDKQKVEGDPTEAALLVFAGKAGIDHEHLRRDITRTDEIPFSSERKYMAVLADTPEQGRVIAVKGSLEVVLDACTHIETGDGRVKMTDEHRREIKENHDRFAQEALRVLAAGYRETDSETEHIDESMINELTFVGLWGMADPARKEAVEAIEQAIRAGIRVVLVSGDYPVTAAAIAEQTGITESREKPLTGTDIDKMSEEELIEAVAECSVFARVSPSHKARIKDAFQARGHIVAMTGDGVNDAPALKGADIGVAMGASGTEVAREAADMILTDDNFETIIHAVEEGRVIFSNLQRVVFFLITTSLGEVFTIGGAIVIGMPLPLTPIMILWINLVTDAPADVPLGLEPRHRDVLGTGPQKRNADIVGRRLLKRMLLLSPFTAVGTLSLFYFHNLSGDIEYARTVAFTTLAAFQWFLAYTTRTSRVSVFSVGLTSNRWLLGGILLAILFQIGVIYTGLGQTAFSTIPLLLKDWLVIIPVASTILIADEIFKKLGFFSD